jgi:hypothetical protein
MARAYHPTSFIAILFLVFVGFIHAHDVAIELTPDNFDSLVAKSDNIFVIEYYSAFCGAH